MYDLLRKLNKAVPNALVIASTRYQFSLPRTESFQAYLDAAVTIALKYVAEILEKYGFVPGKTRPSYLPLPSGQKLLKEGEPLDTAKYPYCEAVGSLLYAATRTRPEISHAVGSLARHMAAPKKEHWDALTHVLRYLATTPKKGLCYGHRMEGLVGFADANYSDDPNDRKSITGTVFLLNGGRNSLHQQPGRTNHCCHMLDSLLLWSWMHLWRCHSSHPASSCGSLARYALSSGSIGR